MTDPLDYRTRAFRFAGCFSPDEIRVLDRVLDETLTEAALRTRGAAQPFDIAEMRGSFATAIIASATRGDLDPVRLKASALLLLEGVAKEPRPRFTTDRATG